MDSLTGTPGPVRLMELDPPPARPAHERARELLEEAAAELSRGSMAKAQVTADIARGWATLALTEGVPEEQRWQFRSFDSGWPDGCSACHRHEQVVLPSDWQAAVEAGASVPIVGCGNPWHYVFPVLQSQG